MTESQQAEIQTFMGRAISLQYHFFTFNPTPHAVCTPTDCIMRCEPTYDPVISVCNRDSRNIHICTATLCKVYVYYVYTRSLLQFRNNNYNTGDIICGLTARVIGPYASVPDFVPVVHRYIRFNIERQRDTIYRILTMIIYTNKDSHQVSCITAEIDILCQVVCNAWAFLKPDRATARRLVFFTVTCVFLMRSGIQPYHIFPKIMEFAAFNKPAVIETLRDIKGPYYIRFSPKTMSDYNTATLYQMRYSKTPYFLCRNYSSYACNMSHFTSDRLAQ